MRVLFSGEVPVDGQPIYVESDEDEFGPGRTEAFAGQGVGLCGAMMEGALFLETGNEIQLTITLHAGEPPVDERARAWEEIVEVSFTPDSPDSRLLAGDGEFDQDLDLEEACYRVRYCASGMDQADRGESGPDGGAPDRYLLELWPSAPQPPRLLKQTSEHAAQSHEFARSLRAFTARRPPAQVDAQATRREAEERARRLDQQALDEETARWGGRLPSRTMRRLRGSLTSLAARDLDLAEAVVAADPDTQRAIVRWAVHRVYGEARLADLDWAAPALDALERAQPLPPPFDDHRQLVELLRVSAGIPTTAAAPSRGQFSVSGVNVLGPVSGAAASALALLPKRDIAVAALLKAANNADPSRTVLNVLDSALAVFERDDQAFLDDVRNLLHATR